MTDLSTSWRWWPSASTCTTAPGARLQTLGLDRHRRRRASAAKTAGWVVAVSLIVTAGFSLVPLFVLLGVISK